MGGRKLYVTWPVCMVIMLAGGWLAIAGDLDPPPGPPTSTMKTLVEVEPRIPISSLPFLITEPGSYYLTGNLTTPPDTTGISISASNVTIDLNGFAISGSGGGGIGTAGPPKNILVRNGTVRDFAGDGIDLRDSDGSVIENVRAQSCGEFGLRVGKGGIVRDCAVSSNSTGIGGLVGCLIVNCTSRANTNDGINVGEGSTVTACVSLANGGDGINTGNNSTITSCTIQSNGGNGVTASRSSVIDCTAARNAGDGISVTDDSYVARNNCDSNGNNGDGAGIHVLSGDSRIEGNNVTNNDRGIDVDGGGNIVIKNSAFSNGTNYDIVGGNNVGEITNDPTSAGPWANFIP